MNLVQNNDDFYNTKIQKFSTYSFKRKVYSSLVCTAKTWNRTTAVSILCSIIFALRIITVKASKLNRMFRQLGILQVRDPQFMLTFSEVIITIGMLVTAVSFSSSLLSEVRAKVRDYLILRAMPDIHRQF